ncbi:hypothetical protein ACHAXT_005508 [Thalassiosira profunda]
MAPAPGQRHQGIILAAAFVSVAYVSYSSGRLMASSRAHEELMGAPTLSTAEHTGRLGASSRASDVPMDAPTLSTAEEIVRQSYQQTFGGLPIDRICGPDVGGMDCSKALLSDAMQLSGNEASPMPWWFITLLRDWGTKGVGVHALWHNLTTLEPPVDFCTIEKVATTQWRNVQCFLNEGKKPSLQPRPCHLNAKMLQRRSYNVSRVVMLRDPLERLLSGYINKCVHKLRRRMEGHCAPNEVFNGTSLTEKIRDDPKQLFAAYVDGFPLKWNIHFFPMSVFCGGLFRHIDSYDFVGRMDNNFYQDLAKLSDKLGNGNKLPVALEKVFHLSDELAVHKDSNVGKETQAASHVKEYFTAASVRRALAYYAVDYVRLGLTIPSWVHEMLAEENLQATDS